MNENNTSAQEYWDSRYGAQDRIWSGNPNAALVREASDLAPGSALDLGCGEGGDAIWLAQQGWRVTAVDISGVAIARAAEHAAAAGVGDLIDWQRHDLAASFPSGTFDLVSAQFLHSDRELPRDQILRAAASAVAPGGVLLVVGHAGHPSFEHRPDHDVIFPTPDDVLAALDLPDGQWEVLLNDVHERSMTGADGKPAPRMDNTLKLRRVSY